jgi:hypothetical protein
MIISRIILGRLRIQDLFTDVFVNDTYLYGLVALATPSFYVNVPILNTISYVSVMNINILREIVCTF